MNPNTIPLLFSTGSLYPLDVAHCFALAAEAGFDGIEIMCDYRYSTRSPQYLQSLSEQHELPVMVAHTPFVGATHLAGWDISPNNEVERVQCTVELAEALGAKAVVVHLPHKASLGHVQVGHHNFHIPWWSQTRHLKRWIQDGGLAQMQGQTQVKIAIENMPRIKALGRLIDMAYWNTPTQWREVHEWLTLDTTHWATKGIDPITPYKVADGRVAHVHLSNYDGREHRLPQQGDLDLAAFLRVLAEDGYAGTVAVEVHPDALEFDNPRALKQNMKDTVEFCRQYLAP